MLPAGGATRGYPAGKGARMSRPGRVARQLLCKPAEADGASFIERGRELLQRRSGCGTIDVDGEAKRVVEEWSNVRCGVWLSLT